MKSLPRLNRRLRAGLGSALVAATLCAWSAPLALAGDSTSTNTPPATAKNEAPEKKPAKKTGAELYAINCNRCHPERYPTEYNPAQWKTLMIHMRVRANLPAKQAKEVLRYLQDEAGN
jgi:hypothetical protein